jgi:hypothetical protein
VPEVEVENFDSDLWPKDHQEPGGLADKPIKTESIQNYFAGYSFYEKPISKNSAIIVQPTSFELENEEDLIRQDSANVLHDVVHANKKQRSHQITRLGLERVKPLDGDEPGGEDSPAKIRYDNQENEEEHFQRLIMIKRNTVSQSELMKNSICGMPRQNFFDSKAPGLFLS